jgi:hypothetical protein
MTVEENINCQNRQSAKLADRFGPSPFIADRIAAGKRLEQL